MSEEFQGIDKRDRSPAFPYIALDRALDQAAALLKVAKRHEVRLADAASAWGMTSTSSSGLRTAAALKAFGLIDDNGSGPERRVRISELASRILEDSRPGVKEKLLQEAALKPDVIARYAAKWADGRPEDGFALSDLKFESRFTEEGAQKFLRVFDDTMRLIAKIDTPIDQLPDTTAQQPQIAPTKAAQDIDEKQEIQKNSKEIQTALLSNERQLMAGILSKNSSFRLIVSGPVGPKEIDKLIAKLVIDKDILGEVGPEDE